MDLDRLTINDSQEDYHELLRELRSGQAQLIDIREQSEWEQARFQCAIHVPLSDLIQGKGIQILKELRQQNKKIYLHCRSGQRVQKAREVLAQYGCTEFRLITLNMLEMLEQGFRLTS
ncbi:MAG: hypothetical protein A2521_04935 [Deltaproteobacteria bacterium RIFOXYD12_FULL_57_12]|nr:MAG: hypothetical protein A2521_04935 [Deltaproteobacteria bacterium RIFOXYD12_FULL_57_12]